MRRIVIPLVVLGLGCVIGLAMVEVMLRVIGYTVPIWYDGDAMLGWHLRPGVQGVHTKEGFGHVKVNSAGQRDEREHPFAKPPGVYRIAVIGDSYPEAMEVDQPQAFWSVLENRMSQCLGKPVEAINFGVSGYGTVQASLILENMAMKYQPDLILHAFTTGNDIRNNSPILEPEKERPFYRLKDNQLVLDDSFARTEHFTHRINRLHDWSRRISDHSRLVQLGNELKQAYTVWRDSHGAQAADAARDSPEAGLDYTVLAPPKTPAWNEAWTLTERLLARMSAYSHSHGVPLAVADVTHAKQIDPDPRVRDDLEAALGVKNLFYVEDRLGKLARQEGFQFIPLAPEMQKVAEQNKIYLHGFKNTVMGTGHWNADGHRVAGEIMARELCNAAASKPGS